MNQASILKSQGNVYKQIALTYISVILVKLNSQIYTGRTFIITYTSPVSPIHWNKSINLNMMDYLRKGKITVEVVNSQSINTVKPVKGLISWLRFSQ